VISGVTPTGQALARVTRVSFSGRQSSDPEGQSLRYSWDFGDGSAPQTAGDVAHTFAVCACTVRLTVTDPTGLSDTTSITITSRKVDGSWSGQYSSSAPGFSVVLSQGTTNFSGPVSDGSEMRGILSDPRSIRFLVEGTPQPPSCQESRSFEGTLNETLDRIDATGESCSGGVVGLVLTR
jgi:PKD repeat protein